MAAISAVIDVWIVNEKVFQAFLSTYVITRLATRWDDLFMHVPFWVCVYFI